MKHLTLLLPSKQHNLSTVTCIIGAYEIFEFANAYYRRIGREPLFSIQLAGISEQVELKNGMFTVKPEIHISRVDKTNLIIIPSYNPVLYFDDAETQQLLDWIKLQYRKGAEVASLCSGAFLLAASGLLDGKSCSTHWKHTETFRKVFPKINLRTDNLITDESGIYTNGGAYSFLNLMVYLVEKYYDRQTAILCAKVFQIEMDRNVQSEFVIFTGQKQHDDEIIQKAQTYIEQHLEEKISITDLASKFNVGRRNFDRRFIKATGNTPIEYSQRVKIEAAKKAFETNRKTINEVMYEVGYSDTKAFREVFRKVTGMSPLEYKGKYYKAVI
ncbi:GlxA family transcriptional regulator [Flavobacterium sp.]|uniref:GlxA family transcriptional regulator n=1 Tax=Flavobacterium sp. TaxID=239 RepID=UPI00391BC6C1